MCLHKSDVLRPCVLTESAGGLGSGQGGDGLVEDRSHSTTGEQGLATEDTHRDRGRWTTLTETEVGGRHSQRLR